MKIGRNELCPCGSGKKYKKCCLDMDNIEISGSIYKCFKCGEGDLSDEVVEIIKKVTRQDMEKGHMWNSR